MAINVYYSTDAGAPALSNAASALINVLKACLCDGYGSKAAAGWSTSSPGTNARVFQPAAGNRFYLYVSDPSGADARVWSYETLYTNKIPTTAQLSAGGYWRKSSTIDGTARPWIVVAGDRYLYLWVDAQAEPLSALLYFYGDLVPDASDDAWHTLLYAATSATNGSELTTLQFSSIAGHWLQRSYDGATYSAVCGKHSSRLGGNSRIGSTVHTTYPPLRLAPVLVHTGSDPYAVRGELPGLLQMLGDTGAHLDTFTGTGDLAGQTWLIMTGYLDSKWALRIA